MTFAEACDYVISLSLMNNDLFIGEMETGTITDPLRDLVNFGVRCVAREIAMYDLGVPLTLVAGQSEYDLNDLAVVGKRITRPMKVTYGDRMLMDADGYPGVWSVRDLHEYLPYHRGLDELPVGETPRAAVYLGTATGKLLFVRTPNSALSTPPNTLPDVSIEGFVLPNPQTSADDAIELPIPYELHEAACYAAAEKGRKPFASDNSVWVSIGAFNAQWKEDAARVRSESKRTIYGGQQVQNIGRSWV